MPRNLDWEIPGEIQPKPGDCSFDLDRALGAVLGLRATVPEDAFTAGTLGTERAGSGVLIRERRSRPDDRLSCHRSRNDLADFAEWRCRTGARPRLRPGNRVWPGPGARPVECGAARARGSACGSAPATAPSWPPRADAAMRSPRGSSPARNSPGYWEYVLDRAIFTAPAHPFWGGAGADRRRRPADRHRLAACPAFERPRAAPRRQHGGADRPVAADPRRHADLWAPEPAAASLARPLRRRGRRTRSSSPASPSAVRRATPGCGPATAFSRYARIRSPASPAFWRRVWAGGPAGSEVQLQVARDGETMTVRVLSADRTRFLKTPKLH